MPTELNFYEKVMHILQKSFSVLSFFSSFGGRKSCFLDQIMFGESKSNIIVSKYRLLTSFPFNSECL